MCKDICICKEIRLCLVSTAFDFSLAGKAFLRSGGGGWSEEGTCTLLFLETKKHAINVVIYSFVACFMV